MGRPPILRETVLKVLSEAKKPLGFTEIKMSVEKVRDKKVVNKSLSVSLSMLVNKDVLEKTLVDGRVKYVLTSIYYKQAVKRMLLNYLENTDLEEIKASFHENIGSPCIIISSPTIPEAEQVADAAEFAMVVDWRDPKSGIAAVIFNDFVTLPLEIQEGITQLLMWAYWAGVQGSMKRYGFGPLEEELDRCLNFSQKVLKKLTVTGDVKSVRGEDIKRRARGEEAIIKILKITKELIKRDNLWDFIQFSTKRARDVNEELDYMVEGQAGCGESIFNTLTQDKIQVVASGLEQAGLVEFSKSIMEDCMDEDIWNNFVSNFIPTLTNNSKKVVERLEFSATQRAHLIPPTANKFEEVRGDLETAVEKVKALSPYLKNLTDLVHKRRIVAIYLWNVPLKGVDEKYNKMPLFEGWFTALREGDSVTESGCLKSKQSRNWRGHTVR